MPVNKFGNTWAGPNFIAPAMGNRSLAQKRNQFLQLLNTTTALATETLMPTGCADFDKVGENRSANEFYETCTVVVLTLILSNSSGFPFGRKLGLLVETRYRRGRKSTIPNGYYLP